MPRGKKALILKLLEKESKIIYRFLGAETESQKANMRKALNELQNKVSKSSYRALTENPSDFG